MSNLPYPGYPPSYTSVPKVGGYTRQCLVIEICSLGNGLDDLQLASLREQLELVVERYSSIIEKYDVVLPMRFDPLLKKGLRLN